MKLVVELMVGQRFFDGIQVLTLDVFDQSDLEGITLLHHFLDECGNRST